MFQRNFPSDRRIHSTQWRCNVSCRSTSVINVDSGPLSSWRWKQRTVRRSIDFKCDTWCPVTSLKFFLRKWIISCHFRSDFNFFFLKKGDTCVVIGPLGRESHFKTHRQEIRCRSICWMNATPFIPPPSLPPRLQWKQFELHSHRNELLWNWMEKKGGKISPKMIQRII